MNKDLKTAMVRCIKQVVPGIGSGNGYKDHNAQINDMTEYLSKLKIEEDSKIRKSIDLKEIYGVKGNDYTINIRERTLLLMGNLCDDRDNVLGIWARLDGYEGKDTSSLVSLNRMKEKFRTEIQIMFDLLPSIRRKMLQSVITKTNIPESDLIKNFLVEVFVNYAVFLPVTVNIPMVTLNDCRKMYMYKLLHKGYVISIEDGNSGFILRVAHNNYKNIILMTSRRAEVDAAICKRYGCSAYVQPYEGQYGTDFICDHKCMVGSDMFDFYTLRPTFSYDVIESAIRSSNQDYFFILDGVGFDDYWLKELESAIRNVTDGIPQGDINVRPPLFISTLIDSDLTKLLDDLEYILGFNSKYERSKLIDLIQWIRIQKTDSELCRGFEDIVG